MPVFLAFLAKYWKELLIAFLFLIISASWYYDRSSLIDAMDSATSRYEQELLVVKESHARELKRKEDLTREYEKKVEGLRSSFLEKEEELFLLRSARVKEITILRQADPGEIAERIESEFGFTYVD